MSDVTIWRYLDLAKFISLIQSKKLFLCRTDKLNDPYEGTINKATHVDTIKGIADKLREHGQSKPITPYLKMNDQWVIFSQEKNFSDISKEMTKTLSWIKEYTYINCWHINDHESEAMWKLYSKNLDEALCIKTSIDKLSNAIDHAARIEPVDYIDYSSNTVMNNYFLSPFTTKRIAFRHEQEVRIIVQEPELSDFDGEYKRFSLEKENQKQGHVIPIKIDLKDFIDEIRLSPTSPNWFGGLIKDLLNKYDLDIPVKPSDILLTPFGV